MELNKVIAEEFKLEMNITTRFFKALTDEMFAFRANTRSMDVEGLVNHMCQIPGWVSTIVHQDELDWGKYVMPEVQKNAAGIRSVFQDNLANAEEALGELTDTALTEAFTMHNSKSGKTYYTAPKRMVLRKLIINHSIHHRAQLGVYMRLNDKPVPATYVASADDSLY